jgi:hypothetical protein
MVSPHERCPSLLQSVEVRGMAIKMKSYKNEKEFNRDAPKMERDGWTLQTTGDKDRHTAIGRTLGKTVLTGGIGLLLSGRSKKGDAITATWVKF